MTNYAMSYPALYGNVVTEGHARYCRENGHATHIRDGVREIHCPRCGVVAWKFCTKCRGPIPAGWLGDTCGEHELPTAEVHPMMPSDTPDENGQAYDVPVPASDPIRVVHNGPRFIVRHISAEQGEFVEVVDKARNTSREYVETDGGVLWYLLTDKLAGYTPEDREAIAANYRQRGGVYRPTGPGWARAVADRMVRLSDALDGIDSESDRAKAICAAGQRLFDFSA